MGVYDRFSFGALRYGDGREDYVGLRLPLPHIAGITTRAIDALGPEDAGHGERRAFVMADSTGTLDGSQKEARRLCQLLRRNGYVLKPGGRSLVGKEATILALCSALCDGMALIHYTGHGAIPQGGTGPFGLQTGEEVLVLHDGPFGPSTLRDRGIELRGKPLVVLNSCRTGRTRLSGGEREDLAGSLLYRKAGAVIASAFPVGDRLGAVFGVKLHHPGATSAGDALRRARAEIARLCREGSLHEAQWPAWALLTYHGNPWLRLPHHKPADCGEPEKEHAEPGWFQSWINWVAGLLGRREEEVRRALAE
jgi:hypothetical protein